MSIVSSCFVAFPVFVGGVENVQWCWECCCWVIHCVRVWSYRREVECIGGRCWCGEERLSDWSPLSVGVDSEGKDDGVGV